jgi:hypothetical protein
MYDAEHVRHRPFEGGACLAAAMPPLTSSRHDDSITKQAMAAAVRMACARTGLDLEQFAQRAGIDRGTLRRITAGQQDAGMTTLNGIVRASGWTWAHLGNAIHSEIELRLPGDPV